MLPALMSPEVLELRVSRTAALRVVSERVTASLPRLLMPDESKAVFKSAAAPVSVLMLAALMVPEVRPSRSLRTETASVVSERVTASLPRLLMPEEA